MKLKDYPQDITNPLSPAVKITQLNLKNEKTDGYSLGDVLLLQKYERELKELSWTKSQIELLSPAFYGRSGNSTKPMLCDVKCDPFFIKTDTFGYCKQCGKNLGYVRK